MTALYEKYNGQGLEIVAFPCNQFGAQEPGSNAEIKAFATDKFGFNGLMMDKIDVNGPNTHPVWVYLKEKFPGDVRWNFAAKFIVDRCDLHPPPRDEIKQNPLRSFVCLSFISRQHTVGPC